ncbi:MAG: type II secretion system protein [Planctomycetota bacterium]
MKMSTLKRTRRSRRGGFTLIELVMVIMILAIIAGLVVPIVGWLRRSANYAAQANTAAAVGSNLEFYRTTYGNNSYPGNMDSLLVDTGGTFDVIDTTDDGGANAFLDHGYDFLIAGALTGDNFACISSMGVVFDHTVDRSGWLQGSPGNSGTVPRTLASGGNVAYAYNSTLHPAATNATEIAALGETEQRLLLQEIYPEGVPSDVTLVAMGIGKNNEMIGRTMQSVPTDPRVDPSEVYGRYVGIYAVYSPREGRRAQLKAVLNAFGRSQNNALSEFWGANTPE